MSPPEDIVDFRVRLPADRRPPVDYPASFATGYGAVLGLDETYTKTAADLALDLAESSVSRAVIHAEYEFGDIADALNDAVAEACVGIDDRTGFGTVTLDSSSASRMVRQVRHVAALGLRGLNLQPAFFGRAIDDPVLYAVYAAAEEEQLVVALHTGINYSRTHPIDGEQPIRLDRVAASFESLRLVACHGGWPWTAELAAVARRQPHVYIDFGAIAPKYVGRPGAGWDVVRTLMDNVLADRVLFASDWPAMSPARCLDEWRALGLKAATLRGLLGDNARRLLSWP